MKRLAFFYLTGVLAGALTASAQSFDTTVGSSQLYGSSGLVTEYRRGDVYAWAGIGYANGLHFGSFYSTPLRLFMAGGSPPRLEIGDQSLSAYLDVDEYDSHSFTVRGAGVARKSAASRFQLFAGALTEDIIQPYTHFATTSGPELKQTPLAAFIYERKLSKYLQIHSLNLFTGKLTSIQSVGWRPSKTWRLAGAGGLGFGTPYVSAMAGYRQKFAEARLSYTLAGHAFHRQEGPYASNEPLGFNARVEISPTDKIRFGVAHERTLTFMAGQVLAGQPALPSTTILSTFNSANGTATIRGVRLSASATTGEAENSPGTTTTELLTATRKLLPRWTAFGSVVRMKMSSGRDTALININEFRVNSRLALRQNYTRMNGQNSYSTGGEWRSNLLSFSVDHQLLISPLAAAVGSSGMLQAWNFSIRLRAPHGTTANIETFADPMGHMQWGGYLQGLRYDAVAPSANQTPEFSKYVVQGLVVDQSGKGVWGIALAVGHETVFSDDNGAFFLHVKNGKPLPLSVDVASSLQSAHWTVASAPATVLGTREDAPASPVRIVINVQRHGRNT